MKTLIKNDDAVSIVMAAILMLAVVVTFISIFTSSWVPIYEGNAEADHSDTTSRTFMNIHKQIELADELSNSATIDLGTDDTSFIKNSYSVGYLEVNESSGGLFLTTNLTRIVYPESSFEGIGLGIVGINTSLYDPLENFEFDLVQTDGKFPPAGKLDADFIFQMATTYNRWITLYNSAGPSDRDEVSYIVKYGTVKWETMSGIDIKNREPATPYVSNVDGEVVLHVDLLDSYPPLVLVSDETTYVNDSTGYAQEYNNGGNAPLGDVIQHWAKFGNENDYFIHYMQYSGVTDGQIYADVENGSTSSTPSDGTLHIAPFDNEMIGGGTLTMKSDYNFMVDQSYVYDNGAVLLSQNDGVVFKTSPPIVASNNSGTLSLSFNTVELNGNLQTSGNGIETLYSTLIGDEFVEYGNTDRLMIVKETTPEYYNFWRSYFEKIKSYVYDNGFTDINATLINNTDQTNMTLTINATNNQTFYVTVNTKVIQIS